jgi:hypothetical protein
MHTTAALQPLGEYIGLKQAKAQFGLPESTMRAYVADGRLPAYRTPSGRLWLRPQDVRALFTPVTPKGKQ